jgi:hypothetical protein
MFKNYIQFVFLSVSVVVLTGFMCCCKKQECEATTCGTNDLGAGCRTEIATDTDDQEFGIEELEEETDYIDK